MPTTVKLTNGTTLIEIPDQTINTQATSINLIGRGATSYTAMMAENFVHILENFAGGTPPARPLAGQLWFNNQQSVLNFYNGANWVNITNSSSGGSGTGTGSTPVDAGSGLSSSISNGRTTISLTSSGVTAGTYTNATVTVDQFGRVTAAVAGSSAPSGSNGTTTPTTLDYASLTGITSGSIVGRIGSAAGNAELHSMTEFLDTISSTSNSILVRGGAGWQAVTPSTAGQVLTSAAAGPPVFAASAKTTNASDLTTGTLQAGLLPPIPAALVGANDAWISYTPQFYPDSGSYTGVQTSGGYIKIGRTVSFFALLYCTGVGSGSGQTNWTLPLPTKNMLMCFGRDFSFGNIVVGVSKATTGSIPLYGPDPLKMNLTKGDNTAINYSGGANWVYGTYETTS